MIPASLEALADLVRDAQSVPVPLFGRCSPFEEGLSFAGLKGEVRHDVADGVVSCLAGTTLDELNAELRKEGRCLPYDPVWPGEDLPLANLVLLGLPHALEGTFGSWRDWILGATMVTAAGERVKSGSRVVKSVAGYDAHKLLVGSRGALALPGELVFRTFPTSPATYPHPVQRLVEKPRSILRVKAVDLCSALLDVGRDALWSDEATATLWTSKSVQDLPTYPSSWCLDPFCPSIPANVLSVHRRAKSILDPGGKLAPGAFHNL